MRVNLIEVFLGLIVVLVSICFLTFLYIKVDFFSLKDERFSLTAKFDNINGILAGSSVKMAGVDIGSVKSVDIDLTTFEAVITMDFKNKYNFPDDSEASIQTDGLLGGSYVSILPGGSDVFLFDKQEIVFTQGATSLINLMLKFAGDD
jgi:phospholipid/cholesterol/gamma-HCH transport system substrate-binding protein